MWLTGKSASLVPPDPLVAYLLEIIYAHSKRVWCIMPIPFLSRESPNLAIVDWCLIASLRLLINILGLQRSINGAATLVAYAAL